jgi:hypothetical protein
LKPGSVELEAGEEPGAAPAGNSEVHGGADRSDVDTSAPTTEGIHNVDETIAAQDNAANECHDLDHPATATAAPVNDECTTQAAKAEDEGVATNAEDADGAAAEDLDVADYEDTRGADAEDHHDAVADYNDEDDAVAQDHDEAVIDCDDAHDAAVTDSDDDAVAPFVATERVCMGLGAGPPAGFERCGAVESNAISQPRAVFQTALGRALAMASAGSQPPRRPCPSPPKDSNGRRFQRCWQEEVDRQAKRPRVAGEPQPPRAPPPLPTGQAALSKSSPPQRIAQPQPSATPATPMPSTYARVGCQVARRWMVRLSSERRLLNNMMETHFSHIHDFQRYMLGRLDAYEIREQHATHLG